MKLSAQEVVALAGIIKASASNLPAVRKKRHEFTAAYPSYSRSLVGQLTENPNERARSRALGTGALGAVLGALAARIISNRPGVVGLGALGGAAIGAIPGYQSGKSEAMTDRSKMLFLKRLGITRPGELEVMLRNPELAEKVTEEGGIY